MVRDPRVPRVPRAFGAPAREGPGLFYLSNLRREERWGHLLNSRAVRSQLYRRRILQVNTYFAALNFRNLQD